MGPAVFCVSGTSGAPSANVQNIETLMPYIRSRARRGHESSPRGAAYLILVIGQARLRHYTALLPLRKPCAAEGRAITVVRTHAIPIINIL